MGKKVNEAVVIFLKFGNEYLLLRRADDKQVDPGKYNGIGGKLTEEETYLGAAVRKTREEAGYELEPKDFKFLGLLRIVGCKHDDWVIAFFGGEVIERHNWQTEEGGLEWVKGGDVLKLDVVQDLVHLWPFVEKRDVFFATMMVDEKMEVKKIEIALESGGWVEWEG